MVNNKNFTITNGVLKGYSGEDSTVIVPDGVKSIRGSYMWWGSLFPETVKKVVLPEGMETIDEYAFSNCVGLEELVIPESVTEIRAKAFYHCDRLPYIIAPSVPLKTIENKVLAALGYCSSSESFPEERREEYDAYIRRQKKRLVERAKEFDCKKALAQLEEWGYYTAGLLSEKEKVLELEKLIMGGNTEKIKAFVEKHKSFEFTARALGFACRCCEKDLVAYLMEKKFSFKYSSKDRNLIRDYGTVYETKGTANRYPAEYFLLAICGNVFDTRSFGEIAKNYKQAARAEKTGVSEGFAMADESIRVKNIEYVMKKLKLSKGLLNRALMYSVVFRQELIMKTLADAGAVIDVPQLCESAQGQYNYEYDLLLEELQRCNSSEIYTVLKNLIEKCDKKIILKGQLIERVRIDGSCMDLVLDNCDDGRLKKTQVVKDSIWAANCSPGAIRSMLDHGFMSRLKDIDALIEEARKRERTEMLTMLLDYKNSAFDLEKEKQKQEAKDWAELSAKPDSVRELRKLWSYRKLIDGSLMITSYKGLDSTVMIPVKIGKSNVTVLGEEIFSKNGIANRTVEEVIVPEGVKFIDVFAFAFMKALKKVSLPKSVVEIAPEAFIECEVLDRKCIPSTLRDKYLFTKSSKSYNYQSSYMKKVILDSFEEPYTNTAKLPAEYENLWQLEETESVHVDEKSQSYEICGFLGDPVEITVPARIGDKKIVRISNAFEGKASLKKVTISEGIEVIGDRAFTGCTSLDKISFPKSLVFVSNDMSVNGHEMGIGAFDRTPWMDKQGEFVIINNILVRYRGTEKTVAVPDGVTTIGEGAFFKCSEIEEVVLPASVKSLQMFAFNKCRHLKKLVFNEKPEEIESFAFYECGKKEEIIENHDFISGPLELIIVE